MLGNTMELLMRKGNRQRERKSELAEQDVDTMWWTARKADYLKFIDPRHPLRTAYQTNSQFLSFPWPPLFKLLSPSF